MCFVIRFHHILLLLGIYILSWYHRSSSFHWNSPSAIFYISFSPLSKLFLMAWISSSLLLASWLLPSSLSVTFPIFRASIVMYLFSSLSQYPSFGTKIPTFLVSLLSCTILVRASGFPCSFPGMYSILKFYWVRSCIDLACFSVSSFVVIKIIRFLWLEMT